MTGAEKLVVQNVRDSRPPVPAARDLAGGSPGRAQRSDSRTALKMRMLFHVSEEPGIIRMRNALPAAATG